MNRLLLNEDTEISADVVFIVPAFAPIHTPSPGVSSLQAVLHDQDVRTKCIYANVLLAEKIGTALYEKISGGWPTTTALFGEWLLSSCTSEVQKNTTTYFEDVFLPEVKAMKRRNDINSAISADEILEQFSECLFISEANKEIIESIGGILKKINPKIVGFTTVFQQSAFSIEAARYFKKILNDDTRMIIGGANCEKPMGLEIAKLKDTFDIVVSGEGEELIVDLVSSLLTDSRDLYSNNFSTIFKSAAGCKVIEASSPVDMQKLIEPVFVDYLDCIQSSGIKPSAGIRGTLETSRGCWWGQKNHCTFCGLNGGNMKYRSKSKLQISKIINDQSNVLFERVDMVDNIIDLSLFEGVEREDSMGSVKYFAETKSNLKEKDFDTLMCVGIDQIQPGIESLNNLTLKLMNKGVNDVVNIHTLRVATERNIAVFWNFLWGFPGETADSYEGMINMLPQLHHLPPPGGWGGIRIDRFSPLYDRFLKEGAVKPYAAYGHAFPEIQRLENFAYFFELLDESENSEELNETWRKLASALSLWTSKAENSVYSWIDNGREIHIFDNRDCAKEALKFITGKQRDIFLRLEDVSTRQKVCNSENDEFIIQDLLRSGVILESEKRLIRLPVKLGGRPLYSKEKQAIQTILKEQNVKVQSTKVSTS